MPHPMPRLATPGVRRPPPIIRRHVRQDRVRERRILCTGFVGRVGGERLPETVMFGELFGARDFSDGQEEALTGRLAEPTK